jgi:hypothetical protein
MRSLFPNRTQAPRDPEVAQSLLIAAREDAWRQWRSFLREEQDKLQRRMHALNGTGDDELTLPLNGTRQAPVSRLKPEDRQRMQLILDQRLQDAKRQAEVAARQQGEREPDGDAVLGQLLGRISDELEGKVHPQHYALVWVDTGLVTLDVRRLLSGTVESDYYALSAHGPQIPRAYVSAAIALLAVLVMGYLVWSRSGPEATNAVEDAPTAQIGQATTPFWTVQTLIIGDHTARIEGAAVGYPLLICLPPTLKAQATPGTTITLVGAESRRQYRLHADAQALPRDLMLADCTTEPVTMRVSAELVETATRRVLDPALIGQVTTWGPDTDPATIPPERMLVELVIRQANVGTNTLILADGSRWQPTTTEPITDGVQVSFLVPLAHTEQEAGWERASSDGLPSVLALTVPAPRQRQDILGDRLVVEAVTASVDGTSAQRAVGVTLTLRLADGAPPLNLLPGDLQVTRPDGTAITAVRWNPPRVESASAVTVPITIPISGGTGTLDVQIGTYRARVRW